MSVRRLFSSRLIPLLFTLPILACGVAVDSPPEPTGKQMSAGGGDDGDNGDDDVVFEDSGPTFEEKLAAYQWVDVTIPGDLEITESTALEQWLPEHGYPIPDRPVHLHVLGNVRVHDEVILSSNLTLFLEAEEVHLGISSRVKLSQKTFLRAKALMKLTGGGFDLTPLDLPPGSPGAPGQNGNGGSCNWGFAVDGTPGTNGGNGQNGANGASPSDLDIDIPVIDSTMSFSASGGAGQNGGNGGNGGKGGDGVGCLFDCHSGKAGGKGGNGGNGGNGGDAPHVWIYFCTMNGVPSLSSAGGPGGKGGLGGKGGKGGAPATSWGCGGGPDGADGANGANGSPGAKGKLHLKYSPGLC